MRKFHQVKLELVRPGPPHNQLLSPLTPYMALCGEGSPITFHINIEHHQLLSRLERLRYLTTDSRSGVAVPNRIREATVAEIGEDVARILGELRTLLGEEWRTFYDAAAEADNADSSLIHLRLVLSGSELSLLPFEMAIAPQAFPGEGLEWTLQFHMPVVPTREIRRTRLTPVSWDRPIEPRILLVSAAPLDLDVPLASHVQALRAALEPWIRWPERKSQAESPTQKKGDAKQQRLQFVKERLRIIPDASIEDIYETCSTERFTHVHILAHGAHTEVGGEARFGLALCAKDNPEEKVVVSGKRLAKALQAEGEDGSRRSRPLLVTLATCDSGNQGQILIPGGSIAHDLHTAGIPWVFASQFPLTKIGSVRMAEALYPRLLRGDDPRLVLYEVRRQLFMRAERDHDWASLVAYSTVSSGFEDQVMTFFERQMRRAITISLNRAGNTQSEAEMKIALKASRQWLKLWKSRLPKGDGVNERSRRAECYGMHGSTWKRIGLLHCRKTQEDRSRDALKKSLAWYRKAMEQWAMDEDKYHWVATQALSLAAVLQQPPEPEAFLLARHLAKRDLAGSKGSRKAWAHGTMAELEMLTTHHAPDKVARNVKKNVQDHCKAIVDLMGEDSFEVYSTKEQFQRYIDYWDRKEWQPIARAAVDALSPLSGNVQLELPPYA
jgi:hypothetical protein